MKNPGEEIFDVVSETDEVLEQATRKEVHQRGLRHRAVHVLIFNAKGEVFLQKRSLSKECFPGTWDSSASGHLDSGESYDSCAIREVEEELGLSLPCVPQGLFKVNACPQTGQEFVWVYRYDCEGPFVLNREEIDEGKWFAPDYVDRWMARAPNEFAGALLLIWPKIHNR